MTDNTPQPAGPVQSAALGELRVQIDALDHQLLQLLNQRARVAEQQPEVDSLVALYGSAAFMERECHEMYGIRFRGNDDLRPLLLYDTELGPEHGLKQELTSDWQEFEMIRPIRRGREFQLCASVLTQAEVHLDDVQFFRIEAGTPENPVRMIGTSGR